MLQLRMWSEKNVKSLYSYCLISLTKLFFVKPFNLIALVIMSTDFCTFLTHRSKLYIPIIIFCLGSFFVTIGHPQLEDICYICFSSSEVNKFSKPESLIACFTCKGSYHLSCLKLPSDLRNHFLSISWTCFKCKKCQMCEQKIESFQFADYHFQNEKVFRCCNCDNVYHSECVSVNKTENRFDSFNPIGRWACPRCGNCASCLARWSFEWKMEFTRPLEGSKRPRFLQTHCVDCSNKFKKGHFCALCLKAFNDDRKKLINSTLQCGKCFLLVHIECDERIPTVNLAHILKTNSYMCLICREEAENLIRQSASGSSEEKSEIAKAAV